MANGELADSVEGLYKAFAEYPLPAYTDPCLHCHTMDDEAKLRSKPLRELGIDELRDYANDALLVWGDERVFKHFLPRIYELYVTTADAYLDLCDPEIMFSKFRHGQWRTWPQSEQAAIESFLHALWAEVLADPPEQGSFVDVESWLCSLGQSEDELSFYLSQWIDDERQPACLALSALLIGSAVVLPDKQGRNAFWDQRDAQYEQLQAWAKSSVVREKLQRARARWDDIDTQGEMETALSIAS